MWRLRNYEKINGEWWHQKMLLYHHSKDHQCNTKPLVRYKGQILDFHFLNNNNTQSYYSYTDVNAVIQKEGWVEKGSRHRKSRGPKPVCAHHYPHCYLSVLNQVAIINFFPFPEKLLFAFPNSYVVAMTRVIHPSDHPSIPSGCVYWM